MDEQAYQCWYEFLKRSTRYRECCLRGGTGDLAALYADFGDIHTQQWPEWWATHQGLFSDVEPMFLINEIDTKEKFDWLFDDHADDLLGLVVNLSAPKEAILAEIDKVLKLRMAENLARENTELSKNNPKAKPKKRQSGFETDLYHRYGLNPVPSSRDIAAFWRVLSVYDNSQLEKKDGTSATRAEIGGKERIARSELIEMSIIERAEYSAENIKISKTVYRDLKWADDLISNVELGIFPKHR
ncbi:MAG: hypothetical protein RR775_19640 [Massilia sp.]|uniref:hypothetical protein n=1 Tax=Massilia sp. TaxID=1882437 RepID=UPI002FC965FA